MRTTFVRSDGRDASTVLRAVAIALTLTTAAFHLSLGGPLFTMNAIGYATLAAGLALAGILQRNRWLVRLALIGFTLATIAGWLLFGARFSLAYLDKSIEIALVVVVGVDLWLADGGPLVIAGRVLRLPGSMARAIQERGWS